MNKYDIDKNPVLQKSFEFAVKIVKFCDRLEQDKRYILARQLLRSGTSIGANAMEAQNAESFADFIHKFKIAAKEGEETSYWLLLCNSIATYPELEELLLLIEQLNRIIGKIITSAKKRNQNIL